MSTTEVYDEATNAWVQGPNLTTPRANISVVVVANKLYAIGGFSGKCFLNTIEYLDANTNEWTTFVQQSVLVISQTNHSNGIQQIERQLSQLLSKSESCTNELLYDNERIDVHAVYTADKLKQSMSFPCDQNDIKVNGIPIDGNHHGHSNSSEQIASS